MIALALLALCLGVALLVAEAHVPSGVLGVLGIAALVGSGFLFRDAGVAIPIPVIFVTAGALGGLLVLVARKVLAAQREAAVKTGWEELLGQRATVRESLDPEGQVFCQGALWNARGEGGFRAGVGDSVTVRSVDGLTLVVGPTEEADS